MRIDGRALSIGAAAIGLVFLLGLALPGATPRGELLPAGRVPTVANGTAPYAGYTGVALSGNITIETAQFNVPTVTCQPTLPEAQLVGIHVGTTGVLGNRSTVSLGLDLNVTCGLGSSAPREASLAYDCVESSCTTLDVFDLSVAADDNVSFRIDANATSGQVVFTIADLTTHVTKNFHLAFGTGVALSSAFWEVEGPRDPCTPTSCARALAQFSAPVVLKDCGLTVAGQRVHAGSLAYLIRYTMVNSIGTPLARASAMSHVGSEFSVRWLRST